MKPPTSDCPRVVLVLGSAVCVAHKRIIFVKPAVLWGFLVHCSAVVGSCKSQLLEGVGVSLIPAGCHMLPRTRMDPQLD